MVLMGSSKHAVSPLRLMLDLLEEVRGAKDANEAGWGAAWTKPQQHGTHTASEGTAVEMDAAAAE